MSLLYPIAASAPNFACVIDFDPLAGGELASGDVMVAFGPVYTLGQYSFGELRGAMQKSRDS